MVIICSKDALDPETVAAACRDNPNESVYALPWVSSPEELHDNLMQNRGLPNRLFPCEMNTKEAEGEHLDFYDRLKDDAFGTMADALKHGTPVLNEIMECPCENAFYGKVLLPGPVQIPGATFIVRCKAVDYFFPTEPISAKYYAMTTVPVRLKNTLEFQAATGCEDEYVDVLSATDYIPRIGIFMDFYKLFTGKSFVRSVKQSNLTGLLFTRWRYNRAYKVD